MFLSLSCCVCCAYEAIAFAIRQCSAKCQKCRELINKYVWMSKRTSERARGWATTVAAKWRAPQTNNSILHWLPKVIIVQRTDDILSVLDQVAEKHRARERAYVCVVCHWKLMLNKSYMSFMQINIYIFSCWLFVCSFVHKICDIIFGACSCRCHSFCAHKACSIEIVCIFATCVYVNKSLKLLHNHSSFFSGRCCCCWWCCRCFSFAFLVHSFNGSIQK